MDEDDVTLVEDIADDQRVQSKEDDDDPLIAEVGKV